VSKYDLVKSFGDERPVLPEILFSVFGEKSCEGGLLCKGILAVFLGERVNLPLFTG